MKRRNTSRTPVALLLVAALMLGLLSACANPRGSYVKEENGGAAAGIVQNAENAVADEQASVQTPLPSDYVISSVKFSTATIDDLKEMYALAGRIVAECDTVSFKAYFPEERNELLIYDIASCYKANKPYVLMGAAPQLRFFPETIKSMTKDGVIKIDLNTVRDEASKSMEASLRSVKHYVFLAMLEQQTKFYVFGYYDLLEDPLEFMKRNFAPYSIFVCTEYKAHGYETLEEYISAINCGECKDVGDIYDISLELPKVHQRGVYENDENGRPITNILE